MIIPRVKCATYKDEYIKFDKLSVSGDENAVKFVTEYLLMFYDFNIGCEESRDCANLILSKNPNLKKNEYKMTVEKNVIIEYSGKESLRNALATLIQSVVKDGNGFKIRYRAINDYSDCGYRGAMIDLARGLPDFERLKEDIKRLSLAKCNYLHLHLSDSRGICYETAVYGGENINGTKRYSIAMLKELAEFCLNLGIEIIPEIEIPAHAHYLNSTHPEFMCKCDIENQSKWCLCAGNDEVYDFYTELIKEICDIFDGEYIHVGGDELCFDDFPQWNEFCHWDICEVCQKRMRDNNLKSKTELYYYLMNRMNEIVKGFGKKMIMWNDQIDVSKDVSLSRDITVEFWRIANENRGPRKGCSFNALLKQGFKVINGNFERSYIDCEEFANPERTASYSCLEYPKCDCAENIIGAEVLAWQYGNPENIFYLASYSPCTILLLDKMWDCSDVVYTDEYKRSLTRLVLGFGTPKDYDMFEIFGSIMPPRLNDKPTYVTIKNDMTDRETLERHGETLNSIGETYSPIYLKRLKRIVSDEIKNS